MKKYLITLSIIIFLFYSSSKGQGHLNKGLFEQHIINQKLRLYDDKYYIKINNNFTYFYEKESGVRVKVIKGKYIDYDSENFISNSILYDGIGIMYNMKIGYTVYAKYDWSNYYRGKVSKTQDSSKTWKEIADFDSIFNKFYHKNEKIFLLDSNKIIVYGMRCKFEVKEEIKKDKTIIISNIDLTCLPNREGYVNVSFYNKIFIENFIYVSKDGGITWEEANTPIWFNKGFYYSGIKNKGFQSIKSNMARNELIWFEDNSSFLTITIKEGHKEMKSFDGGLVWK